MDSSFTGMPEQRDEMGNDAVPDIWKLEDPYRYGPQKPNGDPWDVLLKPLLEKDRMQCNAWADEVQNLLIFAGLFSSVVTTFVIESYRNLQANPQDAMVALLSGIAARLENPLNVSLASSSPIEMPTFSPTTSSVRTNALWFMSLVLSLTTVLIGTISLQWLRQHQSYHDLTPKQIYTLFHMRSRALSAWHVPKLFTILPLFLQTALVLFLIGLIDFLLEFGRTTIVIPVSVVIGFTLFFLLCTTALPALQGIRLYITRPSHLKHRIIPDQCPYKSPQSYIFRNICSFLLRMLVGLSESKPFAEVARFLKLSALRQNTPIPQFFQDTVPQYIRDTWEPQRTWTQFDLSWLSLRDTYMRSALNRATGAIKIGQRENESFPLFDATQALLRNLQDTHPCNSVKYHCVVELSEAIPSKQLTLTDNWDVYETENDYFQELLNEGLNDPTIRISDFFYFNGPRQFQEMSRSFKGGLRAERLAKAFHHENIHMFLEHVHRGQPSDKQILQHRLEIKLRLLEYFSQESHEVRPDILGSLHAPSIPTCMLVGDSFSYNSTLHLGDAFYFQLGAIMMSFFKRVGGDDPPPLPTVIHPHLPHIMRAARRAVRNYWPNPGEHENGLSKDGLTATFAYATQRLSEELAHPNFIEAQPSLLFYISSLYVTGLVSTLLDADLRALLLVLRRYKRATIDRGVIYPEIEERCRAPAVYGPDVFTEDWWGFLGIYVSDSATKRKFQ